MKTKLLTLLAGATLFSAMGATTLSADSKCGAGKCGGQKTEKVAKCGAGKCGAKKAKKAAVKCGAGKCGAKKAAKPQKSMKCGAGKCGSM